MTPPCRRSVKVNAVSRSIQACYYPRASPSETYGLPVREAAISIVYYCIVSTRFRSQPRLSLRLLRCSVYYSTSTMLLSPHLFVQGMSDL